MTDIERAWKPPTDVNGDTVTPQRLAAWLDAKFSRHGEEEDKWAADYIRATHGVQEVPAPSVFDELIAFEESSEVKPTFADAVRIAYAATRRAIVRAAATIAKVTEHPATECQAMRFGHCSFPACVCGIGNPFGRRDSGAETRLNAIEEQLKARGVVDFKITLAPGASKRPVEEVKRAVAEFLEAWLSGNATPLTDFGDSPVLGIAAHREEWEQAARDVAVSQRPVEEIKADVAAVRERIAGATPADGATHD